VRRTKAGSGAKPGSAIPPATGFVSISRATIAASRLGGYPPDAARVKKRSREGLPLRLHAVVGGGLFRHDCDRAHHLGMDGTEIFVGAGLVEAVREFILLV